MSETYFGDLTANEVEVKSVSKENDKFFAELENNPFYPDGEGGQIGDRGTLGSAKILFVNKNGVFLDKNVETGKYKIEIDTERRREIARQHTAQHILSAAVEELFGVKTVGFHMGEKDTTVDFERPVDYEKAVELSNDIILEDVEIEELLLNANEAEKYRLRKPLSFKALQSKKVRLIKIGEFDISACGGFHVSKTGQVGVLRVVHAERIKSGAQRVWFLAGKRALKDCAQKERELLSCAKIFDASWVDLKARIEKTVRELKEKRSDLKKMAESLASYISTDMDPYSTIEVDEAVASFITRKRQDIPYILKISETNAVMCAPFVKREYITQWAHEKGFKGGGKGPIYRFTFSNFQTFADEFKRLVFEEK